MPSAREPESIYRLFGRRLREIRDSKNIPQEELATFSGLTRSSIANIENGKQRVLLHQLVLFARYLKVELADLLPNAEVGAVMSAVEAESQPEKLAYLQQIKLAAHLSPPKESKRAKKKRKNA